MRIANVEVFIVNLSTTSMMGTGHGSQLGPGERELSQFASDELVVNLSLSYIEGWTDLANTLHTQRGRIAFSELPEFLGDVQSQPTQTTEPRIYRFRVLSFPRTSYYRSRVGT